MFNEELVFYVNYLRLRRSAESGLLVRSYLSVLPASSTSMICIKGGF